MAGDIPVHLDQVQEDTLFFSEHNHRPLAGKNTGIRAGYLCFFVPLFSAGSLPFLEKLLEVQTCLSNRPLPATEIPSECDKCREGQNESGWFRNLLHTENGACNKQIRIGHKGHLVTNVKHPD